MDARAQAIIEALGGTKQIRQDFHATDICAFGAGIAIRFHSKHCQLAKVNSVYLITNENGTIEIEFNVLKGNRLIQNAAYSFQVASLSRIKDIVVRTMHPCSESAPMRLSNPDAHPSLFD